MKKNNKIIIIFFIVFIFGIVNFIVPDKKYSDAENRSLQQLPIFSFQSLVDSSARGFTQKFETYISDQILFRDKFITIKSFCESMLLKKENNGIIYGNDNYLFNKFDNLNYEILDANLEEINAISEIISNTNIMIIPSSYEILANKHDKYIPNLNQKEIFEYINSNLNVSIKNINIYDALIDHNSEYIYYKNDHHWTSLGAFYAYEIFCKELKLSPINLNNYSKNEIKGFKGTHYNKCKKIGQPNDILTYYDIPIRKLKINNNSYDSLYDLSKISLTDKYSLFLYGNNGMTEIIGENNNNKSILIIKDSFANCFIPYLVANYNKIIVVDLRYLPIGFNEIINNNHFDELLFLYNLENLSTDLNFFRLNN